MPCCLPLQSHRSKGLLDLKQCRVYAVHPSLYGRYMYIHVLGCFDLWLSYSSLALGYALSLATFRIRFLSFCTAELKSEDIFVLRRVRAFSGYSFCWLNPQTTCLFTLAYCTVKTFQPPSSLHRDCYRNL